jgi:hypothetical protein
MKIIRFFAPAVSLLLFSYQLQAQGQIGYYGIFSKPVFIMDDMRYRGGFGASIEFLSSDLLAKPNKNFQLRAGASLAMADQQRIRYNITLDTPDNDPGKITYNNTTLGADGILKLIYARKDVKPYVDVFLGGRNYYSKEKIESDKYIPGYQSTTQSNVAGQFVLDLGASMGLLFKISPHAHFDLRASYATSPSQVQYVDLSSVKKDGNAVNYNLVHTRPQLLIFRLGFVFDLCGQVSTGQRSGYHSNSNYQPNPGYNPNSYPNSYSPPSYSQPKSGNPGNYGGGSSPKPLRLKPNVPKS